MTGPGWCGVDTRGIITRDRISGDFSVMEMINTSVVVLAEQHNPSILHPSFLERQGIVEKDWAVTDGSILSTPPYSTVQYTNGIKFVVEMNRLQIFDESLSNGLERSYAPILAKRYTEVLPHVKYLAVGMNFVAAFPKDNAAEYLISRCLNKGEWRELPNAVLGAAGIKLVYKLPNSILTVNLDLGVSKRSEDEKADGMLLRGNFHMPIEKSEETVQLFSTFGEHCDTFEKIGLSMVEEGEMP